MVLINLSFTKEMQIASVFNEDFCCAYIHYRYDDAETVYESILESDASNAVSMQVGLPFMV